MAWGSRSERCGQSRPTAALHATESVRAGTERGINGNRGSAATLGRRIVGSPQTDAPPGTASPWSHPHRRPGPDRPRPRAILSILGFAGHAELVGLADVHDHRRSGFVQLGHLRTVDRLALLVDLVDKWSDLSIPFVKSTNTPTSRTEYRLLHERITLPTTFNAKSAFPTLYLIAARMLPILVSRVAFRAALKRIYR